MSGRRRSAEEILVDGSGFRVHTRKLRRALIESGVSYTCSICGQQPEWQGKPLVLQIDHIDGDWSNNRKENLRFLCLHCHSQTPTFGYKGRKPKPQQYTPQTCGTCGKSFLRKKKSSFCSVPCANARPRPTKATWPSDGELSDLIWQMKGVDLAKSLGVSLSALIKRCRQRGIETPGRGYWQKVQAGSLQTCECSANGNTPGFQPGIEGSIPSTRSRPAPLTPELTSNNLVGSIPTLSP